MTPEQQIKAQLKARGLEPKNYQLDPFTFGINFLPIAASATITENFLVQADSAFAICKTSMVISDDANAYVANLSDLPHFIPMVVTLTDSGSGRDLMNTSIALSNIFGSAREPFVWARPKVLDPNSTFNARLQNLIATARNVRLAFHGFKIFGDVAQFKEHQGKR